MCIGGPSNRPWPLRPCSVYRRIYVCLHYDGSWLSTHAKFMTLTMIIPPTSLTRTKFDFMAWVVTHEKAPFWWGVNTGRYVSSAQLSREVYVVRTTDDIRKLTTKDVRKPATNHPWALSAKWHYRWLQVNLASHSYLCFHLLLVNLLLSLFTFISFFSLKCLNLAWWVGVSYDIYFTCLIQYHHFLQLTFRSAIS